MPMRTWLPLTTNKVTSMSLHPDTCCISLLTDLHGSRLSLVMVISLGAQMFRIVLYFNNLWRFKTGLSFTRENELYGKGQPDV